MNHLLSQWRTASNRLVRALTDQGTVDVARSLWNEEMNSPGDLATELDYTFEPSWEEIEEARRYISRVSQDMLRARHGDTITVYRSGPVDSNRPQATTLKRYTAETFGEPGTYQVNISDVLYYSEALWGHGTFAEEEVGVMGRNLRVGKTAALGLDQIILVAEQAMERKGQSGRKWHIPVSRLDVYPEGVWDPKWRDETHRVREFVSRVVGASVHIYSRENLPHQGEASPVTYTIVTRPDTDDLTLLHECAHLIRGTSEGGGHDEAFIDTLADLYGRYIGLDARETFESLTSMVRERA